jgi:hypothetical protein
MTTTGGNTIAMNNSSYKLGSLFEGYDDHWGKHNCLHRSELETICPEGDFSIEVGMYLPSQVSFA